MYLKDIPEVAVPSVLGAILLFSLGLILRLTKILKSLYLYNDFHLEPLAVYKPTSTPSFSLCAKTLIPLWGALHYSSPQFDLPPAAHFYLSAMHLSLLWAANLLISFLSESLELALTAAAVATGIALTFTYVFHSIYLSSFNHTDLQDITLSQSVSDLQRSDVISTVQPHKRGVSWASVVPSRPASVPVTSLRLEGIVMCFTAVTIGVNCWSLGVFSEADSVLYGWLMGIGVDIVLRLALCLLLTLLKAGPNFSVKYWLIDFGLTPAQIHSYRKQPIVDQCELSESEHIRKDTFSMEQLVIAPPPTTPAPMLADYELELPANYASAETLQWAGAVSKHPSPTKSMKASPDRAVPSPDPADSESSQGSADTLPEMPHNLQSPVESPSIESHFHFFRTPERPYFASPEKSPVKPEIRQSPGKKGFELVLRPIEGAEEVDWKPVDLDQEVFIVEYLPGGIMPRAELQGSQYHLEAQECPVKGSFRSQSLPKPVSEVVQRAKSVIRQPSTPRLPEVTESWMPADRPVHSAQNMYPDLADIDHIMESEFADSPRELEQIRRLQAAKQTFKHKRQQVNRSVSPYNTLLSDRSSGRIASAEALQALAQIYTPHLPQTPPPLVRRGRYLKKALMDE